MTETEDLEKYWSELVIHCREALSWDGFRLFPDILQPFLEARGEANGCSINGCTLYIISVSIQKQHIHKVAGCLFVCV